VVVWLRYMVGLSVIKRTQAVGPIFASVEFLRIPRLSKALSCGSKSSNIVELVSILHASSR
jgi:hypothetical protein